MRSTLPGIPLFERWIFIFIWQDVDIKDTGYIPYLVYVYPAEAVSLAVIGKTLKADNRLKNQRLVFVLCFSQL